MLFDVLQCRIHLTFITSNWTMLSNDNLTKSNSSEKQQKIHQNRPNIKTTFVHFIVNIVTVVKSARQPNNARKPQTWLTPHCYATRVVSPNISMPNNRSGFSLSTFSRLFRVFSICNPKWNAIKISKYSASTLQQLLTLSASFRSSLHLNWTICSHDLDHTNEAKQANWRMSWISTCDDSCFAYES